MCFNNSIKTYCKSQLTIFTLYFLRSDTGCEQNIWFHIPCLSLLKSSLYVTYYSYKHYIIINCGMKHYKIFYIQPNILLYSILLTAR